MHDYKSNFSNALDYGYQKTKMIWWKILIMGILASVYVGIAYVAYIYILSWFGADSVKKTGEFHLSGTALVVASLIFPVGLMMITMLGGSLFTSDALSMLAVLDKKAKLRVVFRNLAYVFIGNLLGGLIIAAILRGAHAFKEDQLRVIEWLISKKVSAQWWEVFFSAILCNLIVAGTVWSTLATNGAIGKIIIIFFFIWLFTVVGFHHVVANLIIFSFGWLFQDVTYTNIYHVKDMDWLIAGGLKQVGEVKNDLVVFKGTLNQFIDATSQHKNPMPAWNWTAQAIVINSIPSLIGNWFSGAVILPLSYWAVVKFKADKYGTIDTKVLIESEIKKILAEDHTISWEEAEKMVMIKFNKERKNQAEQIAKDRKKSWWNNFGKKNK